MNVNGKHYRSIWLHTANPGIVQVIDQRKLPHEFIVEDLKTVSDVFTAIKDMHVRGAGLIGATAGFGMYLAALTAAGQLDSIDYFRAQAEFLKSARPTAVNLAFAVDRQLEIIRRFTASSTLIERVKKSALDIADEDANACRDIGKHGVKLIRDLEAKKSGNTINILTHCNAGWLAFVDYGSATAPIYAAHAAGIDIHVWVDETRPRNQGARLTAWELEQEGVPYTVITDNAGGHLMQRGLVDLVLVGSDRTTYTGDVANKIGTYLKALAAMDNNIPVYAALPSSSFDWNIRDGLTDIPIETRDSDEVRYVQGLSNNSIDRVLITTPTAAVSNYAFDVTPSRLITGLITERGICAADETSIKLLFPEMQQKHG